VALARRIWSQFQDYTFASEWARAPELMLWITMMTAVASRGRAVQTRAVVFLALQLDRHSVLTWDDFRHRILMNYLWLPMTNDRDGIEIWSQVEHIRTTRGHSQGSRPDVSTRPQTDEALDLAGRFDNRLRFNSSHGIVVPIESNSPEHTSI
jgi:hypothetical protein